MQFYILVIVSVISFIFLLLFGVLLYLAYYRYRLKHPKTQPLLDNKKHNFKIIAKICLSWIVYSCISIFIAYLLTAFYLQLPIFLIIVLVLFPILATFKQFI